MKNSAILLLAVSMFILSFTVRDGSGSGEPAGLIRDRTMVQVALVVYDIETAARNWAGFFGVEVPDISLATSNEQNPTRYMSEPTNAKAKLAFINLENITVELIEPVGGPSTWADFLEKHGEGVHHIAFDVKDMDATVADFEKSGIPIIQHGGWDTGEYSYMDGAKKLGVVIELLEHYDR